MGFFDDDEIEGISIKQTIESCGACKLYSKTDSPKFRPIGKGKKKILIVLEAPDKTQDSTGKYWAGDTYRFLEEALRKNKINIKTDCWITSALRCFCEPKEITPKRLDYCSPSIDNTLDELKPHLVLVFGGKALRPVIKDTWKKSVGEFAVWRGWVIPDQLHKCWIAPLHKLETLEQPYNEDDQKMLKKQFMKDLKNALSHVDKEVPILGDLEQYTNILTKSEDVIDYLKMLLKTKPRELSFDYETTGIKPHRKKHKILTVSFCFDEKVATAFEMKDEYIPLLKKVLTHPKIGKVAQNMKYEMAWTREKLGVEAKPFIWDTMLGTHILDARTGITGLKFQTFVQLGIAGYEDSMKKWIGSTEEEREKHGCNGLNRLAEAPMDKVLIYNALDSFFEHRLMMMQVKKMRKFMKGTTRIFDNFRKKRKKKNEK